MAEYHVACGTFGIYAGTLNKKQDDWKEKSEVTREATEAVAQFLLEQDKKLIFSYKGKRYIMSVEAENV